MSEDMFSSLPRRDEMDQHFVILLYLGPAYDGFPPASPEQGQAMVDHVRHVIRVQAADGPAIAGGPLVPVGEGEADATAPLGMVVLKAGSLEEAQALAASDPGVTSGRFRAVVMTWMMPRGQLSR